MYSRLKLKINAGENIFRMVNEGKTRPRTRKNKNSATVVEKKKTRKKRIKVSEIMMKDCSQQVKRSN